MASLTLQPVYLPPLTTPLPYPLETDTTVRADPLPLVQGLPHLVPPLGHLHSPVVATKLGHGPPIHLEVPKLEYFLKHPKLPNADQAFKKLVPACSG